MISIVKDSTNYFRVITIYETELVTLSSLKFDRRLKGLVTKIKKQKIGELYTYSK